MHLAQQPLARGRLLVDAVDDEADVPLVMLALGPLGERADILDRQRMQMQHLAEPAELIRLWVVQVEPKELVGLYVLREPIEVARLEHGERRAAGAHAAQLRAGPGGAGSRGPCPWISSACWKDG